MPCPETFCCLLYRVEHSGLRAGQGSEAQLLLMYFNILLVQLHLRPLLPIRFLCCWLAFGLLSHAKPVTTYFPICFSFSRFCCHFLLFHYLCPCVVYYHFIIVIVLMSFMNVYCCLMLFWCFQQGFGRQLNFFFFQSSIGLKKYKKTWFLLKKLRGN